MKKFKLKELLLTLLMAAALVFASCSADSSSDDGGSSDPVENPSSGGSGSDNPVVASEETKTGKISIVVNVDGTVTCGKCEKTYSTKAEAEACEHYKCATCGTVYYSEDDANDCTSHVTVTFKDVESTDDYTAQTAVTKTVKSGSSVSAPEWARDKYVLSWVDESDAAVTFPVTLSVDEGETEKTVAYTAVWTKIVYYSVTFHDSDGTNADDVQQIESGKKATVPSWTKENFTLSWNSSVDGLLTDSAITADVTFTTEWTEKPKCSVCGTHYDTEEEAAACSKQEGCPNYGKVTLIALVGSDGNVISGNSNVTVNSASVNSNTDNGAIELTYEGTTYKTVKLESKSSIVVKATAGQTITVVGSLPSGTKNCFKVGSNSYKLASKTTEVTTFEKSFTSTGSDTITKGDKASIALIIIQ